MSSALALLPREVPVDPDAEEARDLILRELANPEYQAAQPSWFDLLVSGFWDWLQSLQVGGLEGPPVLALIVAGVLLLVAVGVAFLVYGAPRLNRRSRVEGALFGEDDARDAAAIRRAAQTAADAGDYTLALQELYRALARSLAERTIVSTSPGTTAYDFARRAGAAFPVAAERLRASAVDFDEVRYLGREGTREAYDRLDALERELAAARPELEAAR